MITISEKALEHVFKLRNELGEGHEKMFLRVGVKGGGCSGFSYVMDFDDEIKQQDEIIHINDDLTVLIEKKSLLYLFGTELNYSDGLNGKGFEWSNPQANRTCGCGLSFSV
jgi:iron-sulfur cluster assembly protein